MIKLLIMPALIMLCGVCKAQFVITTNPPQYFDGENVTEYVGAQIDFSKYEVSEGEGPYTIESDPVIISRNTTVNSLAYFPADTSFLIEWYSVDTDSSGTQWHSSRNERIYLTGPEAAGRLQAIGGDVQIMGEALRTEFGLN